MDHKKHPILFIDPDVQHLDHQDNALALIIDELKNQNFTTLETSQVEEGLQIFSKHTEVSCVLFEWGIKGETPENLIKEIRKKNHLVPIFIMIEKHKLKEISSELLSLVNGYLWKMEDTPYFIAGRIEQAILEYLEKLLPPFFKELMQYVEECKYSWHTPGHSGGLAFLKSPVGHVFYNFFGENVFRSDLSVSVPELGSLMEHSGVNGEAEKHAAKLFGADQTYFVTNGTSTANKIVANAALTRGDVVLIDRNCHKSLQHALTLTGAIPIYLIPSRNAYGIIGGIDYSEFSKEKIRKKIQSHPLLKKKKNLKIKLAVITNSTYDGLIYDVVKIKDALMDQVEAIHFDEAWYAYAKFHPIYKNRFAMCSTTHKKHPVVYSTQSTHKLLAAFSQASMIHVKDGQKKVDPSIFNEAFMMHTSTSPQYNIIASLDVAGKMMEGSFGKSLLEDAIDEALSFRLKMQQIAKEIQKKKIPKNQKWWFSVWQPPTIRNKASSWELDPKENWHGYPKVCSKFMMLDPIKVTLLSPGIDIFGEMDSWGIPAPIVARFLWKHGIVDEKTGFYTFLTLFSLGITKGKSSILLSALFEFKKAYDEKESLQEIFPELVKQHPQVYERMTLIELCQKMHLYLKKEKVPQLTEKVFSLLPDPVYPPQKTYEELVRGNVKTVPIRQLKNQILAVMLVPYPPGIPVIMPGEKITAKSEVILDYLTMLEGFDEQFPGFQTETHGIEVIDGKYYTKVLK